MQLDWATIGAMTGLMSFIVGGATVHLRMFVSNALSKFETKLRQDFIPRETLDTKIKSVERRLDKLEAAIDGA